jgi:hypothetical protein
MLYGCNSYLLQLDTVDATYDMSEYSTSEDLDILEEQTTEQTEQEDTTEYVED